MPTLNCRISQSLQKVLEERSKESGESIDHLVTSRLSRCLDVPLHTFFQVSTSGALGVHVDYRDYHKLFEQVNERSIH
jgi:acetolactate decarboxylase